MNHASHDIPHGHFLAPDFAPLMAPFDLDAQDAHHSTIYGLRHDLTLGYVNAHWMRFAEQNRAPRELLEPDFVLRLPILDAIVGPLRRFYRDLFHSVLRGATPRTHDYECPSSDKMRSLHMDILPLPFGDPVPDGLLTIHSRVRSRPIPDDYPPPKDASWPRDYLSSQGVLVTCSNCRRFRTQDGTNRWDWLPDYLNDPPAPVSHGLCRVCLDYYHPIDDDR
jgi:hypothetical protein